jgi:hypothetical protein
MPIYGTIPRLQPDRNRKRLTAHRWGYAHADVPVWGGLRYVRYPPRIVDRRQLSGIQWATESPTLPMGLTADAWGTAPPLLRLRILEIEAAIECRPRT